MASASASASALLLVCATLFFFFSSDAGLPFGGALLAVASPSTTANPLQAATDASVAAPTSVSLDAMSDYFRFQDLLFGPTNKEMRAFCLFFIDAWEAAERSSSDNAGGEDRPPAAGEEQKLLTRAERHALLLTCEAYGFGTVFEALGGSPPPPPSATPGAAQPFVAPHGTLLFRTLPGLFWKGAGFGDGSFANESAALGVGGGNVSAIPPAWGPRADPVLVLSTGPTNALSMVTATNRPPSSGRGSSSSASSSSLLGSLWSSVLWQWRVFIGANVSTDATNSQTTTTTAAPTTVPPVVAGIGGVVSTAPDGPRPDVGAFGSSNPSRHQLGASLAVLCNPLGFANTAGGSLTPALADGSTQLSLAFGGSLIVTSANFTSACGIGDFRPANVASSSSPNATTNAAPATATAPTATTAPNTNRSSLPYALPFPLNTTRANATRIMRGMLHAYLAERLRGAVFSLSWDRAVAVEAFADTGSRRADVRRAAMGGLDFQIADPFPQYGLMDDRLYCSYANKNGNGGSIETTRDTFVPSFMRTNNASTADATVPPDATTTATSAPANGRQGGREAVATEGSDNNESSTNKSRRIDRPRDAFVAYRKGPAPHGLPPWPFTGYGSGLNFNYPSQTISNTFLNDFANVYASDSASTDCTRIALRASAIAAVDSSIVPSTSSTAGGADGAQKTTAPQQQQQVSVTSADIIIGNTVVACEPLASSYASYATMRPIGGNGAVGRLPSDAPNCSLGLLRPIRTNRMSERTAAGSSFAFSDYAAYTLTEKQMAALAAENGGWPVETASELCSLYAYNYVLGDPFAYAEMSPIRQAMPVGPQAERSTRQLGTRLLVEEAAPISATDPFSFASDDGVSAPRRRLLFNSSRTSPVVGLVGLSPAPSCQTTSAVAAYHSLSGALAVSRNMSALTAFLANNLRIFGPEGRYGYRLDLSSNFGGPMASYTNPLSPTIYPDGENSPNIAWFDVLPRGASIPHTAASDASRASDSATAEVMGASQYPFPLLAASAIGGCPSGRRVISEVRGLPKGDLVTQSVTVVLAAPTFSPLVIGANVLAGLYAWTNLSCYTPSASNAADVEAMGGPAAFALAANINGWSSHPLKALGIKSMTFLLCRARKGVFGFPNVAAGSFDEDDDDDEDVLPRMPPSVATAAANLPSFTLYPDGTAGGGVYPTAPSGLGGAASTAFYASLESRSMKIRLSRMGRPHARYGTVAPIYVAGTAMGLVGSGDVSGEGDGAAASIVVLGSAALVDYLVLSDSATGRIGFAPALSTHAAGESARLTTRFTTFTSPEAVDLAQSLKTPDPYGIIPPSQAASPSTGGTMAEAAGADQASVFLAHSAEPYDGDGPLECAYPVKCASGGNIRHIRALNACVDPSCGSWLTKFNETTLTCEHRWDFLALLIVLTAAAVGVEALLHCLTARQLAIVAEQQRASAKKEV